MAFLNSIIRFSLRQPLLIVALALVVLVFGTQQALKLPIDVFPDLNRPRVVVLTECPGLAPEEVETLVTIPLETALNGATGVLAVRSGSGVGISVVYVEFDWGTDIYIDRQIVNERLALVQERMPEGIQPQLAPISSIMGQIMIAGMYVDPNATPEGQEPTSMLRLRELADWVVKRRLLTIPGVAQVFTMGGENGGQRQVQVLVDPNELRRLDVTLEQVETALQESNENATGGYLVVGPQELLVRSLGRIERIEDLENLVVDGAHEPPVLLGQVARVVNGPEIPRGIASVNGREAVTLVIAKQPGADTRRLTAQIERAFAELEGALPADVRIEPDIYRQDVFIDRAIENVMEALRDGGLLVVVILFVFLMNFRTTFITLTAIPLSMLTTVLVFSLFDMSINTMTLGGLAVAIGELVDDAIVDVENIFRRLRENRHLPNPKPAVRVVYEASTEIRNSIVYSTMVIVLVFVPLFALGGMEGRLFTPLGIAYVVSILASLLVSLTVTPVLAYWLLAQRAVWQVLAPLVSAGLAYGASLVLVDVLAPLAAGWFGWDLPLAPGAARLAVAAALILPLWWVVHRADQFSEGERDGPVLRALKAVADRVIRFSLAHPWPVLVTVGTAAASAVVVVVSMGRNFLPPFNEGSVQVNVILPAGTSLYESERIGRQVDRALMELDFVEQAGRRTGRAEEDEHAAGVNVSELILSLDPESPLTRDEQLTAIRAAIDQIPGIESASGRSTTEQPIAHLMSHMMSGVFAQIAIKIYGDDLAVLRNVAEQVRGAIDGTPGVVDLQVEQQVLIPQLQIRLDRPMLAQRGLTPGEVNHQIETAMNGRVVSRVLEGEATFDLVVRFDDPYRENIDELRQLALQVPSGGSVPLEDVAEILPDRYGPNTINRENARRRIVVQCNTSGRALSDVRDDIVERVRPIAQRLSQYGPGYFVEYGGQFESEQAATRILGVLSIISVVGMFLVLYTLFRSVNLALQVMSAIPMAAIGAVAAIVITGQSLSVPNMVGFISLAGIASRNGILLITHYLHLVRYEGEQFTWEMVVRAGKERLAPVMMTALTAGIALVPLALSAGEPGKEILYPVATVILGGLISSTLLDFFVHPALFWKFGRRSAERLIAERELEISEPEDL